MKGIIKRHQRRLINRRISSNIQAISISIAADESFAQREHLYMRHHELLEQRDGVAA